MARSRHRPFTLVLGAAFAGIAFVATQAAAEIRWPWNQEKQGCGCSSEAEPQAIEASAPEQQSLSAAFEQDSFHRYVGGGVHWGESGATLLLWRLAKTDSQLEGAAALSEPGYLEPMAWYHLLPVHVSEHQGFALQQACSGSASERPLTHQLLRTLTEELSAELVRVTIDKIDDNVFHGTAWLKTAHGREITIDARPSDLLPWAVRAQAPVFVNKEVERAAPNPALGSTLMQVPELKPGCF